MSILTKTFGETPLIKVIDFFLTFREFDYSKSQIATETGVSRITMEELLERLLKNQMVVKTRKIGRAELYRLNFGSPRVKALIEMDMKISSAAARENILKVSV